MNYIFDSKSAKKNQQASFTFEIDFLKGFYNGKIIRMLLIMLFSFIILLKNTIYISTFYIIFSY